MKLFHEAALLELLIEPQAPAPPPPDDLVLWLQAQVQGYRTVRFGHGMDLQTWLDAFRTRFTNLDAAGGVVQDADQRVLTMFRRGYWDLPKGKVDEGETLEKAALREVREETGLHRLKLLERLPATYHIYRAPKHNPALDGWQFKTTHWFRMQGDARERLVAQTSEDIEQIQWTPPVQLITLQFWPSVREVLNQVVAAAS